MTSQRKFELKGSELFIDGKLVNGVLYQKGHLRGSIRMGDAVENISTENVVLIVGERTIFIAYIHTDNEDRTIVLSYPATQQSGNHSILPGGPVNAYYTLGIPSYSGTGTVHFQNIVPGAVSGSFNFITNNAQGELVTVTVNDFKGTP
ncbi:hypothetical protein D3C80_1210760 [compost metagenome]